MEILTILQSGQICLCRNYEKMHPVSSMLHGSLYKFVFRR